MGLICSRCDRPAGAHGCDCDPQKDIEDLQAEVERLREERIHEVFGIACEAYHEALEDSGCEGDWAGMWGNSEVYKRVRRLGAEGREARDGE